MKATVEIPDALYREIKIRAARDGVKVKDLVAQGLSAVLRQAPPAPPRKKNPSSRSIVGRSAPCLKARMSAA
jgi:hypothetical protein